MPGVDGSFRPILLRLFSQEELDRCEVHFAGLPIRVISLPWMRKWASAITFGRHVYFRPDYWEAHDFPHRVGLLAHELTHVRQYRRYGLVPFLALYSLVYPLYLWRVRQHPLERPAYQTGQEVEALAQAESPTDGV